MGHPVARRCTPQYAGHCEIKVEQNFYDENKGAARTMNQRSVKVEKMPASTALSSVGQLTEYFAVPARLGLPPAETPLLVRENRCLWRAKMPFTLINGMVLDATLDLYYATPQIASQPGSVPLSGSEFSFETPASSDAALVAVYANEIFETIREAPWSLHF